MTNAIVGSIENRVHALSSITTRDHAGRHFYDRYDPNTLIDLENAALVVITRPVHEATGLSYSDESHGIEVTEEGQQLVDDYPEYWDTSR